MGLFNRDKRELDEALEAFRSTVGSNAHHADIAPSLVQERLTRLEAAVARMENKGKGHEVLAAINEVYDKQLPFTNWGLGDGSVSELNRLQAIVYNGQPLPEVKGSGTAAQAELKEQEVIETHRAADAYCKSVLNGIRARVAASQRG